jgi:hypothetical protein
MIMEHALTLKTVDNRFLISIDKTFIEQDFLIRLMNRIRMEYLAKIVNFDESIEILDEEIKSNWWEKNKNRLLNPE